jgi:fructan beta-fructosidase
MERMGMPDLFHCLSMEKVWLLIVVLIPEVTGGSGIQYFTGDFDGHQFNTTDTTTRWADYGPDNYAGVSFSNTGNEKIFLGWMSNWQYGKLVPTEKWRSAMSFPRKMGLKKIGERYYTTQMPVDAIDKLVIKTVNNKHISSIKNYLSQDPSHGIRSCRSPFFSFIFNNQQDNI